PGTGLGLAICKGIIEAHGGRLAARSIPGKTTSMSFQLPLVKDAQPCSKKAMR
ncbi:MAG: HAMP domain-containing histidine kinase, partial [Nitrospiraceae bacterium]|nr:HAMP domain-containing histidine kinase [Nitrospiraceae bacterium]